MSIERYETVLSELADSPKRWLVTGVAGFIGSHLLEGLVRNDQSVVGLDNFSTGRQSNLDDVLSKVSERQRRRFQFIEGDICNLAECQKCFAGEPIDYVLHQAALGSVPRSIDDPLKTNHNNITGFLNMLVASRDARVASFTYAASSSTYGDHPGLPKVEHVIGKPLSPYAVTKYVNELYAEVFASTYGFKTIGLRYFNVFGPRQDPNGAYAAVIPRWIAALSAGKPVIVNGDGRTSRDFCYVDNVVQANILAAVAGEDVKNNVFNIAVGESTSLNQLFETLRLHLNKRSASPIYADFRPGDVRHSLADISKAQRLLGYSPRFTFQAGIQKMLGVPEPAEVPN